jgi:hypothetical protein
MRRRGADGVPFLATMFHAVGLNVIDPRERKREVLDASTRALRDMIAMSWLRTTEQLHSHCLRRVYDTTPRHLLVGIGLHKAACIRILSGHGSLDLEYEKQVMTVLVQCKARY